MSDLAGRTAVVVGASGNGMGRSIALTLAREGADLVITYRRNEAAAREVAAWIEALGRRVVVVRSDATVEADVTALWERAQAAFGTVDIAVVGAGGPWRPLDFAEIDADQWRRVQAAEQDSAFFCIRAALPGMRRQRWGRIILIGGHAADHWSMGPPVAPLDYPLGKAARHWLAQQLGEMELAHGITANAIAPGWIPHLDFAVAAAQAAGDDPDWRTRPRPSPQDAAEVVRFLCSEAGRFVSGNVINVMPPHFPDESTGSFGKPRSPSE